jgi:hypothetical protein
MNIQGVLLDVDVERSILADPVTAMLLSLTCVKYEQRPVKWDNQLWRTTRAECDAALVERLNLHSPMLAARASSPDDKLTDDQMSRIVARGQTYGTSVIRFYARAGNLAAVQWGYDQGYFEYDLIIAAARSGSLPLVEFLATDPRSTNDNLVLLAAVRSRNPELIRWCCQEEFPDNPWPMYTILVKCSDVLNTEEFFLLEALEDSDIRVNMCNTAAKRGSLAALQRLDRLWEGPMPLFVPTLHTLHKVVKRGYLDVLKFCKDLINKDKPNSWCIDSVLYNAIEAENVEIVKWLLKSETPKSNAIIARRKHSDYCVHAAATGNLKLLKLLRSANFAMCEDVYMAAAMSYNIDMLDRLLAHTDRATLPDQTISYIRSRGSPKTKRWLTLHLDR